MNLQKVDLQGNQACVVYINNPFDFKNLTRDVVEITTARYITDFLPVEIPQYIASINGEFVEEERWFETEVKPGDYLVFCPVPQGGSGGGGGKNALRIISLIALTVVSFGAGGLIAGNGLLATGISGMGFAGAQALGVATFVGGSMLINSLLPPQLPKSGSLEDSNSYGVDGPKNTYEEGIPVPVVYGRYRVGGNICALHTQNVGYNDQFIYMMMVLSEGEISGVHLSETLINDRLLSDYKDYEWEIRTGKNEQSTIKFFPDTISAKYIGEDLLFEDWKEGFETDNPCDSLQFNFLLPNGLYALKGSGGTKKAHVNIQVQYRKKRAPGSELPWIDLKSSDKIDGRGFLWRMHEDANGYALDPIQHYDAGSGEPFNAPPWGTRVGDTVEITETYTRRGDEQTRQSVAGYLVPDGGASVYEPIVVSGIHKNAIRLSFNTPVNGMAGDPNSTGFDTWEYRFRINDLKSNDLDSWIRDVTLVDVNEINMIPINYVNTALLALKIRVTDQLTSIPKVSVPIMGRKVRYPRGVGDSMEWIWVWTDNPAWIAYDMLVDPRVGAGIDESRIDLATWIDWGDYCVSAGLKFNGVFDQAMNIWDALQHVFRAGRAQLINVGTNFSAAIERVSTPTMMFNVGNIVESSLRINWLPLQDRANEIEVNYFDKENDYKQTTLKITDSSMPGSTSKRTAEITLYGVTDKDQAYKEGELMLRMNKYIHQTVTFDAPLEAIACTVGDLIYLQHDVPQWGYGGRTEAGSTNSVIQLDRDVPVEADTTYSLLLHYDKMQRATDTIVSVNGLYLRLPSLPSEKVTRIEIEGYEYAVVDYWHTKVSMVDQYGVKIDRPLEAGSAGSTYILWDTDAIETRSHYSSTAGSISSVSMQSPFPSAPGQYVKWLFGKTNLEKKPFRISSISGDSELTRTITALEYHDEIFDNSGDFVPPPNYSALTIGVGHVEELEYSFKVEPSGYNYVPVIYLNWKEPNYQDLYNISNYMGADVLMRRENGSWQQIASIRNGITQYEYSNALLGDSLEFKVVSVDRVGHRAPISSAPSTGLISIPEDPIPAPQDIVISETPYSAPNDHLSSVTVTVTPPADITNYSHAIVEFRDVGTTEWIFLFVADDGNSHQLSLDVLRQGQGYEVRARGVNLEDKEAPDGPRDTHTMSTLGSAPAPDVTGLTIYGQEQTDTEWGGKDVSFGWIAPTLAHWHAVASANDQRESVDKYFSHYEVSVYINSISAGNLLRTDDVTAPIYHFNYDRNKAAYADRNAGAEGFYRNIIVTVKVVGLQGQESRNIASLSASNPAPAIPTGLNTKPGFRVITIDFTPPTDKDWRFVRAYLGPTVDFDVDTEATGYMDSVTSPMIIENLDEGADYHIKLASFDDLGRGSISTGISATTMATVGELSEWATRITPVDQAFIDANMEDDSIESTKIAAIAAGKISAGAIVASLSIGSQGLLWVQNGAYKVTMGGHSIAAHPSAAAMFSFQNGTTPIVALYEDGEAHFNGSITVTGGSTGLGNFSDAGSLATKDNVDYTEVTGTKPPSNATAGATWGSNISGQPSNSSLLNEQQQWSQVSGAGKPEDYADVTANNTANNTNNVGGTPAATIEQGANRANSGLNSNGQVTQVVKGVNLPSTGMAIGLNLTSDYMGYNSDGTASGWGTYIQSNGNFRFGGSGSNYIEWNGSTLTVDGDFRTSASNQRIELDGSSNTLKFYDSGNTLRVNIQDGSSSAGYIGVVGASGKYGISAQGSCAIAVLGLGNEVGVEGRAYHSSGVAVKGVTLGTSSQNQIAVKGDAYLGIAGHFTNDSNSKSAIYAYSKGHYAIEGHSTASGKAAIYGITTTTVGVAGSAQTGRAIQGIATSNGIGVWGECTSSTGFAYAGYFRSINSSQSRGVFGEGVVYGVGGIGNYGGWFDGTTIGVVGEGNTYGGHFTGGTHAAYFDGSVYLSGSGSVFSFTGTHDALIPPAATQPEIGDIVTIVGIVNKSSISDVIPSVEIATSAESKAVYGVVCKSSSLPAYGALTEGGNPITVAGLSDMTEAEYASLDYNLLGCNGLGEGQINVCDDNGDFAVGDYISTSATPGKGQRYDGNDMRVVVAKILEPVDWSAEAGTTKMVACIYMCS